MIREDFELRSYLGGNRSARRLCSQLDAESQERLLQQLAVQDQSKAPRLRKLISELQARLPGPFLSLPTDVLREIGKQCRDLTSILALAGTCKALYDKSIFFLLFNHQTLSKYLTRAVSQPDAAMLTRALTALDGCDVSGIPASLTISGGSLLERAARLKFQLSLDVCINPIIQTELENWLSACHSIRALNVYSPLTSVTYAKLAIPATLERLAVHAERTFDADFLDTVKKLPKLKVLELDTKRVSSVSAPGFATASWPDTLERIVIGRSQIRRDGLEKIFSSCPSLKEFVLKDARFLNEEDFQAIDFPQNLEVLEMHSLTIGEEGFLKILARCQKLRRLVVRDCISISADAFARAQYAKTLKVVDFEQTCIDDRGLAHVCAGLPALQCINVCSCPWISVEGIIELQVPPSLERIIGYESHLGKNSWLALYCASQLSEEPTALYARAYACSQSPERESDAYILLERTLARNPCFVPALYDLGELLVKTAQNPQEKERGLALQEKARVLDQPS